MNLLHMKYALAVAETKSINKAADDLIVGAPALSRAIKELENNLGVTLFERSPKGMFLTPDGELFVRYAKDAMKQIDDIENVFRNGSVAKQRFSAVVPRASYVADAFASFVSKTGGQAEAELFYKETNAYRIINNILKEDYKLGILRYGKQYESYYRALMDEKGLTGKLITEFSYVLLMSKNSPLAQIENISFSDLEGYTEITHADPYVPSLPMSAVKKEEIPDHKGSRVYVFERAIQFEVLSRDTNAYMWVSPIPQELLDRYGLIQVKCSDNSRIYKDVLIHRDEYSLTQLDSLFISELIESKRRVFGREN